MMKLKYGNTNTFYIPGSEAGLLIDTDYAGTMRAFYKALKTNGIQMKDIGYVMATHFHPDHSGLIGELMSRGLNLLLIDVQKDHVHFSDDIFAREKAPYMPINDKQATVISCKQSRDFLAEMGISGEIIHTPSHSPDSVSLILDEGDCIVGDLEPTEYLSAYDDNVKLKEDWERILSHHPKRVFYAHMPEKTWTDYTTTKAKLLTDMKEKRTGE